MITFLIILDIFLFIYLSVAFVVFLNFLIRPFNMKVTRKDTGVTTEFHGFKKIKWLFIFSLIWPFVMHFTRGDE